MEEEKAGLDDELYGDNQKAIDELQETQKATFASSIAEAKQELKSPVATGGSEVDQLKAELSTIKSQRAEMTIDIKTKEREINSLKAKLNGKDDEVRLKFNMRDEKIEMLEEQLSLEKKEKAELAAQI